MNDNVLDQLRVFEKEISLLIESGLLQKTEFYQNLKGEFDTAGPLSELYIEQRTQIHELQQDVSKLLHVCSNMHNYLQELTTRTQPYYNQSQLHELSLLKQKYGVY